jgi:hypothetical protein
MHLSPVRPLVRLAGPVLLLGYGLLRWADGHDGSHGTEPWWTAGHLAFLGAVLAFVALVAGVRRVAQHRGAATAALVAAAAGGAGIAMLLAGDIWSWADGAIDLPGPLLDALPALFVLGVVGALAALAAARQVSWLEPALALTGLAAIVVDLDLLPFGAALLAGAVAKAPAPARPSTSTAQPGRR